MNNVTVTDNTEPISRTLTPSAPGYPYPISFQVSVTGFLMVEMVLGLSSNLTVLSLYCMKSNLISSVSNIITMNLHVLDVMICSFCIPLTITVVSIKGDTALVCCFHEACVSFASVATAANVLAITLDRYDISVKPANRVLTMGRALSLLAAVWALSLLSFLLPFMEVGFHAQRGGGAELNQTAAAVDGTPALHAPGLYYHLLAQIPIFMFTAVVMLVTYNKILQALNIRIGGRFHHGSSQKKKKTTTQRRNKRPSMSAMTTAAPHEHQDPQNGEARGGACGAGVRRPPVAAAALGLRASVSVIVALRRAVRRHRERRARQRRVLRTALLIVASFLLCWAPLSALNAALLATAGGAGPGGLRPAFLCVAYGSTVLHPLLYAFTRHTVQKVLKSKMKKRAVSITEAEPLPANAVVRKSSWIDPRRGKKATLEDAEARRKCLSSEDAE